MFKNVASQKLTVFAFDYSTGAPKTGDAANLTAYVQKDDGTVDTLTDTSASEMDATKAKGSYTFDLTQGESNGDKLVFTGKSTTANVVIVPQTIYTLPPLFSSFLDSAGAVNTDRIKDNSIATDAEVNVANAVWDALTAAHVVANSFGATIGTGASAATIADAVWDELRSGHVAAGSFGEGGKIAASGIPVGAFVTGAITRLALALDTGMRSIRSATAQGGAAGSITLDAGASAVPNAYQYQLISIESGTGADQGARIITGYDATTKVATVTPNWTTSPDGTSVFALSKSGVISTAAPATASENAVELLTHDWTTVTGEASRSLLNALRWNRNKYTIVGDTMIVFKEDDATEAWRATLSGVIVNQNLGSDPT